MRTTCGNCMKPNNNKWPDDVPEDARCKCGFEAKVWRKLDTAKLPTLATPGSIGYDLYAVEEAVVSAGKVTMVRTGLVIKPPEGYFISIRGRSSLGKKLVTIPQSVGSVDPDYCGPDDEILVALTLIHGPSLAIHAGDRVAQILFEKAYRPRVIEIHGAPSATNRGGWGSTGR